MVLVRAFPVEFEVIHPVRCLYQRRPATNGRISEPNPVTRPAIIDLQFHVVRLSRADAVKVDDVGVNLLRDVLELLRSERPAKQRYLALDLIVNLAGNADATGLRYSFQPGGDVDAVA